MKVIPKLGLLPQVKLIILEDIIFPVISVLALIWYIIYIFSKLKLLNKGNNKITEFGTILQRESQNSLLYKQTKSVNNRKTVKTVMTLTWYRHFLRNGGLNQILRRQTSRSHYGSTVPAGTVTVFKCRNKIGKIVVKAVPYSVT